MHWKISEAKGSGVDYVGDAGKASLKEAFRELWEKYVRDAMPLNACVVWDHVRVELWLDSGRVILFPAMSPFRKREEKAMCQITCPELINFYETLIEADLSDDKFEAAISEKEREIAETLCATAREISLPECIGKHSVRVLYYGADLKRPFKEDVLVQQK